MKQKRRGPEWGPLTIVPSYANVRGWCQLSGMTETRTYDLLAIGLLRAKKLGGSTLIDVTHGLQYLKSLPDYPTHLTASCRAAPVKQV